MLRKLRNETGETLVEVLAAILIGALAISLLFNTVRVVRRMDAISDELNAVFNTSLMAAETHSRVVDDEGNPVGSIPDDAKLTLYKADDDTDSMELGAEWHGGTGAWSYLADFSSMPLPIGG